MPYSISKDFTFSASHQLTTLPAGHQCARLHGHNYVVRVELGADDLDEHGMVVDYAILDDLKQWIDDHLDHRHLNDVISEPPTAETLAAYCRVMVPTLPKNVLLLGVGVSETLKTWAWWRP